MVDKEILPPQAIDALAWLDPSLARKNMRGISRPRDAKTPPPRGSEEDTCRESESTESKAKEPGPPSGARRRLRKNTNVS